jgi:glycosyltransferase involved in cell wall biosynthesis
MRKTLEQIVKQVSNVKIPGVIMEIILVNDVSTDKTAQFFYKLRKNPAVVIHT